MSGAPVDEAAKPRGGLSTSLLDNIWIDALDPSYAQVSADRRASGGQASAPRRVAGSLLAAVLVGGAVALAVTQARLTRTALGGSQRALVSQVRQRESATTALDATADKLRLAVASARRRELRTTAAGADAEKAIDQLELQTAGTAVVGPGVEVRLRDAADGALGATLRDSDLQAVVNALWGAGAEAIAVNGLRLGPGTAIRAAGQSILVDFRPIASPYLIAAIGNQNGLLTGYAQSAAAARLGALVQLQGISTTVVGETTLMLAATTTASPLLAAPLAAGGPSGSPAPSGRQ